MEIEANEIDLNDNAQEAKFDIDFEVVDSRNANALNSCGGCGGCCNCTNA